MGLSEPCHDIFDDVFIHCVNIDILHYVYAVHSFWCPLCFLGRVVNVSSFVGSRTLNNCSQELQQRFRSDDITEDELAVLMQRFVDAAKKGEHKQDGWPDTAYGVSKTGLTVGFAELWNDIHHLLQISDLHVTGHEINFNFQLIWPDWLHGTSFKIVLLLKGELRADISLYLICSCSIIKWHFMWIFLFLCRTKLFIINSTFLFAQCRSTAMGCFGFR